jgi:hypothetical protein
MKTARLTSLQERILRVLAPMSPKPVLTGGAAPVACYTSPNHP